MSSTPQEPFTKNVDDNAERPSSPVSKQSWLQQILRNRYKTKQMPSSSNSISASSRQDELEQQQELPPSSSAHRLQQLQDENRRLSEELASHIILHAVQQKEHTSALLQDFMRNSVATGRSTPRSNGLLRLVLPTAVPAAILPSEDYRPEYEHYFGLTAQALGVHKSILVGSITYGFLGGLPLGSPCWGAAAGLHLPLLAVGSALLTSYKHYQEFHRDKFALTPLLPGKSVIAQELCPVVSTKYLELMQSTNYVPVNGDLEKFRQFTINCLKRSSHEAKIRKEKGLAADAPVSIPFPGVPSTEDY